MNVMRKQFVIYTFRNRVTPQTIRIRLGDWRLDNLLQRASNESADVKAGNEDRFFGVQRIVIHKDYEPRSHLNDIAVIRLNRLVTFSDVIGRICLPPPTTDITFEDREATVAGLASSFIAPFQNLNLTLASMT